MKVTKQQIERYINSAENGLIGCDGWKFKISEYLRKIPTEESQFKKNDEFVLPMKEEVTWVCYGAGGKGPND